MTAVDAGASVIGADELLSLYEQMAVIRRTEKTAHDLFLAGLVKGTTHLAAGHEAVAVGAGAALRPDDYVFATYRGHHHAMARGASPAECLAELMSKGTGLCKAKGGSMHLTKASHAMLGSYAIVGAHLPMAAGAAWSAQLRGSGQVAVAFFGDGATNIGAFHEALNLAAVWSLPVLFICENNLYMEYTPIGEVTAVANPAAGRAPAYGIPAEIVDGNDVVVVRDVVAAAAERARAGDGPTVIEALTYRHFGHSRTDPGTYRPAAEVEDWLRRDPLELAKARLQALGMPAESVAMADERAGAAGGVFKTTAGLFAEFGRERVWDTPISEQAILGVAMGAAMTGMRPVAEIMFSDFFACCWDYLANEIPKMRYMTGGQVTVPLVVRTANGGGLGFGAQHSQAVENWTLTIPGLKIAAPSNPADVVGMMAAAIRSDDPVVFFEHKGLFASKGPAAPDGHVVELGKAAVARPGTDVSLVALAATVPMALAAAGQLAADGVSAEVIDLRCLVPLDMAAVLESVGRTSRLVIVEENPYQGGWGGTVASIVADEGFELLDAPIRRVAAACVPLPFADVLEQLVIPTVESVIAAVRALVAY